jgi:putative transposase
MELLKQEISVSEIAQRLGVSRQAIYGWRARYLEDGESGLKDRSRRPHHSPTQTAEWIEQRLIAERNQTGFGSKKILRRLQDAEPEVAWPPRSTIDAVFKRAGLVQDHRTTKRAFAPAAAHRSYVAQEPGEVMTIDFKGQFRLRNGRLCYPLTIADPVSRYLLSCDAFERISLEQTWASLTRVFREYGMPNGVHSDNGVPFGTSGHGRFSTISVRLMKHGIQPTYNRPGHPQDNGRHERMHRTLLEHATLPPEEDHQQQQVRFDQFRQMFNHERPHEGIGLDRPANRHRCSPRPFPTTEPVLEYEPHLETHIVDPHGRIAWQGHRLFISEAFAGERLGFERADYTSWRVHFGSFTVGSLDDATKTFI